MGNGPLLIGENVGEAKAWNPAVPVQAFTGLLMQQKAKRDAEQAELANVLTQVRSDGLRNDADRQEFFNKYNEVKNTAIKNNYERDPMKRAMNKAMIKDQMLQLQDYVNRSKEQGQREAEFAKAYMSNPTAWGDDALNPFRRSRQSALSSPETITDFTTLQRRPDIDKITKDFSQIIGNNLKQQVWQTDRRAGKEGNLTGTFEANSRAINPENVYMSANTYYDLHPDFQRLLQTSFPDVYANNPPEQAKAIAVKNYVDSGLQNGYFGPTKESQPEKFRADRAPDTYYAHLAAREAAALAREEAKADATPPVLPLENFNIPINNGTKGANVKPVGYIPVNSAVLNLAGSPSYNLSTGTKDDQVLSSGDHQLVGAGNFPFVKQGGTKDKKLWGAVATPNFADKNPSEVEYRPMLHVQTKDEVGGVEDHLVPYERLPVNLSKPTKEALSSFRAVGSTTPAKKNATTPAGTPLVNKSKKAATDYGL